MASSLRRISKSTIGSFLMVIILLLILVGFAMGDIQNVLSGGGFGVSNDTLVSVGREKITEREMSRLMERQLAQVRQQNPEADYSTIASEFEPLLSSLVEERLLKAFAENHGFVLSKRLIDAEIANIPGAKGLGGRFSEAAYQAFLAQSRLTDEDVRNVITSGLLQRLVLTPLASEARVPVGVATPYASMLLEVREGEVALVPASAFASGLNPTDENLQAFYTANRARYIVPEQRVLRLAKMGPEQVGNITASEQEIAAYYRANQAQYAAREIRVLSQAVVPDRGAAQALAQRAREGGTFAAAAAPAGFSAQDVALGEQTREQFAGAAGNAVASAAFGAKAGEVVGPVQSDLGWHVVKIESVRREGGRTLDQARDEIAAKLASDKRKDALADLVTRVEDAISDRGLNFAEAVAEAKLAVVQTPLITAAGTSRADPAYKLPEEYAAALKSGFELQASDEPVVETLPNDAGYVLVAPARIVPAAPAPLASIREQVEADWVAQQAMARARQAASAIGTKAARGVPLDQARREAGGPLPPVQEVRQRRLEMSRMGGEIPAPVRILFALGEGKSRMVADPEGRGFFVVKATKIIPGNALLQPSLISRVQNEFQGPLGEEYARQFVEAIREEVKVRRNESAIATAKARLTGS